MDHRRLEQSAVRAGVVACGIELPMSREGGNMGASIQGGLPYQPWAAEAVKRNMASSARDDPHAQCLPDTFLRAYGLPHIVKFVQTPRLLIALEEYNTDYRQIFLDGRGLPRTRTRRGTATPSAGGKATRWSSTPWGSATTSGSMFAAAR
jgi:hypothetical protein